MRFDRTRPCALQASVLLPQSPQPPGSPLPPLPRKVQAGIKAPQSQAAECWTRLESAILFPSRLRLPAPSRASPAIW